MRRQFDIIKKESNVKGLKYIPSFVNSKDNDSDSLAFSGPYPPREVSPESYEFVLDKLRSYPNCKAILEIGIFQNIKGFSYLLSMEKSKNTIYVGLDIREVRYMAQPPDKIHIIKSDSSNIEFVKNELRGLGIDKLSILFIDGFHSINMAINDFKYSALVEKNGLIFLHDTNFHPGPNLLYDAIDEQLYDKELLFVKPDDYGLAMLTKKYE